MTKLRGEQCPATAKRTGRRCSHFVVGGGVCPYHGGNAPAVKAKRMQRIALAEALAADPRRDPAEVLSDVGHSADFLMRQARESVKAGEPTVQLLELTEQAGRWAKIGVDTGLAERQTQVQEAQAAALVAVVRRILDRLELSPDQLKLVPVVVPEELERVSRLEITA